MKFCSDCGRELTEEMRFCPYCGTPVSEDGVGIKPVYNDSRRDNPKRKKGCLRSILKVVLFLALVAASTILVLVFAARYYDLSQSPSIDPYDGMTSEAFKASCKEVSYSELAHYPDKYKGAHVKISGTVIQVMESENHCRYRIATDSLYSDVIYATFERSEGSARLVEDDTVTIYGLGQGLYTYQSVQDVSITIPCVLITIMEFQH